jgi:DNA end-binding protein Ku
MPIAKAAAPSKGNVINLMDALKASLKTTGKAEPAVVAKASKSAKKSAKPKRKAG